MSWGGYDNQKTAVLEHIKKHGSITSWEAIENYRITRISAIIKFLKQDGHNIVTEIRHDKGIKYGVYAFAKHTAAAPMDFVP